LVSRRKRKVLYCLARGIDRAILQGVAGRRKETDYDNAKGFKTWGVVYNGSDSDTVYMAREDGCVRRFIESTEVRTNWLLV
jgi:hypothetical protein